MTMFGTPSPSSAVAPPSHPPASSRCHRHPRFYSLWAGQDRLERKYREDSCTAYCPPRRFQNPRGNARSRGCGESHDGHPGPFVVAPRAPIYDDCATTQPGRRRPGVKRELLQGLRRDVEKVSQFHRQGSLCGQYILLLCFFASLPCIFAVHQTGTVTRYAPPTK